MLPLYEAVTGSLVVCLRRWITAAQMDPGDQSYWVAPPDDSAVDCVQEISELIEAYALLSTEKEICKSKGPECVKKWDKDKDPRFHDPANPLYDPSAPKDSNWRDCVDVPKFRAFLKYCQHFVGRKTETPPGESGSKVLKCTCKKHSVAQHSVEKKRQVGVRVESDKLTSHSESASGISHKAAAAPSIKHVPCRSEPVLDELMAMNCKLRCSTDPSSDSLATISSSASKKPLSDDGVTQHAALPEATVQDPASVSNDAGVPDAAGDASGISGKSRRKKKKSKKATENEPSDEKTTHSDADKRNQEVMITDIGTDSKQENKEEKCEEEKTQIVSHKLKGVHKREVLRSCSNCSKVESCLREFKKCKK
jgi:hypothetical protein